MILAFVGKIEPVAGSVFDFTTPHRIGERIREVPGLGYDHNYCMKTELCKYNGSEMWLCARYVNVPLYLPSVACTIYVPYGTNLWR